MGKQASPRMVYLFLCGQVREEGKGDGLVGPLGGA